MSRADVKAWILRLLADGQDVDFIAVATRTSRDFVNAVITGAGKDGAR